VSGGFDVYVVAKDTPPLPSTLPPWSVVAGTGPVSIPVIAPIGTQSATVHYTLAMPGFQLASGTVPLENGAATIVYDPVALKQSFPNIDLGGRSTPTPGLADTVWASFGFEAADGRFYADHLTLQGPDLYRPQR
jgi:hypothetical protein